MPDFCTCGAELPPDALFCHKCGKPQRELVVPETFTPPQPPPAVAPPYVPRPQPALNFRNPLAIRISLLVALLATLLNFLPFVNWIAGGFFAVFFYSRKTGSAVSVNNGVRLGWITGLMTFALSAILFAAQEVPMVMSGRFSPALRERLNTMGQDPATVEQVLRFLESGSGLAFMLIALFMFITGLSMAGGALGAKVGSRS
jgi:hypothetical protein